MKYIALWEFSRKQDYVFKSNKLIEAVGASLIIKKFTEDFSEYNLEEDKFIVKGGGKTLYIFDNLEEAENFNKKFSLNILKNFPGLEIFMVIREFDEEKEDGREIISKAYEILESKKASRKNSCHQIAFGLERPCESTALPASTYYIQDGIKKYISKEIGIKREFAQKNQEKSFESLIPKGYNLERVTENFVKEEEKSYIAVVHIDGNSMGKKFKTLKNKVVPNQGESLKDFNKRYIKVLKRFSETVNKYYEEAFKYTTEVIKNNEEKLEKVTQIKGGSFPLRPLILAGDDITYISNAFIGIESAKIFIERLSKSNVIIEGVELGNLNACAGAAIVKKGYPFIKAYELSEQLCKNAKKVLVEKEGKNLTVIDFHIAQGEIVGDIDYIRKKDYSLKDKENILTMRPLVVNDESEWRNYENFIYSLERINKAIECKDIGRNKIKALRRELKKGKEAAEHFFKFYKIPGGRFLVPLQGTLGDYCFNKEDDRCMYLDAIEVMDLFIKLDQ